MIGIGTAPESKHAGSSFSPKKQIDVKLQTAAGAALSDYSFASR
jgi:hypothetical protein